VFLIAVTIFMPIMPVYSVVFNDSPGMENEWGFRPENEIVKRNPPPFVWRPQVDAVNYGLQIARDKEFSVILYEITGLQRNVHCPDIVLSTGTNFWHVRYTSKNGGVSDWSKTRKFTIGNSAVKFPVPTHEDMAKLVPQTHPRLMLRTENLPAIREYCRNTMKISWEKMVFNAEKCLEIPLPSEPQKYPNGKFNKDNLNDKKLWWGNHDIVEGLLSQAELMAFIYLIEQDDKYALGAKRILLHTLSWDPYGATGSYYNDEAGMIYMYRGSRVYDWIYQVLTDDEKQVIQTKMNDRAKQYYQNLNNNHTWRPYSSHANRIYHFLGEAGIAFYNEIPDARNWFNLATDIFFNIYPVWGDDDGGWHEGLAYWSSYSGRITWWLRALSSLMNRNAYDLPFFKNIGYFPMYAMPPKSPCGGFGDKAEESSVYSSARGVVGTFAQEIGNPYWAWYSAGGGSTRTVKDSAKVSTPMGVLGSMNTVVEPNEPAVLPLSRVFNGTGLAVLNTTLTDGKQNVQLQFKSSPIGRISHGYNSQNAFLLTAYGQPLFLKSSHRDVHGSSHHKKWIQETKSDNCILIDGIGQQVSSRLAKGNIRAFYHSKKVDYIAGSVTPETYQGRIKRFDRGILFIRPETFIIFDDILSTSPVTVQWLLHAPAKFVIDRQRVGVDTEKAGVVTDFLYPSGLKFDVTDYETPPNPLYPELNEWHLSADTGVPLDKHTFITAMRVHRGGNTSENIEIPEIDNGIISIGLSGGEKVVVTRLAGTLKSAGNDTGKDNGGIVSDAVVAAVWLNSKGVPTGGFIHYGTYLKYNGRYIVKQPDNKRKTTKYCFVE